MKLFGTVALLFVTLLGQGCGDYSFRESMSQVNSQITQSNTDRFKAFSEGMVGCGSNAACQVGLAMGFSANLGQQPLYKPETASDLLHAFLPYVTLGVDVAKLWRSPYGGDSAGFVITGNNNQISGVANKLSSDNLSSTSAEFLATPSISNRSYSLTDEASLELNTTILPKDSESAE